MILTAYSGHCICVLAFITATVYKTGDHFLPIMLSPHVCAMWEELAPPPFPWQR